MSKLIYHAPLAASETSPFDQAILRVARRSFVRIISPYIGVSYLRRIIDVADGWLLISDIEAWLAALSRRDRPTAWGFIRA